MKRSELNDLIKEAGVYPNAHQLLLLKSALYPPAEAFAYFELWLNQLKGIHISKSASTKPGLPQVFDQLDLGSQRLLSLLYSNLKSYRTSYPILEQLSGYYKYVWYKNQLLNSTLTALGKEISSSNINLIALKGIAHINQFYGDFGSRPTVDIDVAVQRKDVKSLVSLLNRSGWRSVSGDINRIESSMFHAHSFKRKGLELDVHIRFSLYALKQATEYLMWERAIASDNTIKYLSPPDELYCVLLHGMQWNLVPPIRWVADSVKIIEGLTDDQWVMLKELIRSENYQTPIDMLRYLNENEFARIPSEILNMPDISESKLLQNQYRFSLVPREDNDMIMARRVFYRTLYKNNGNYLKTLKDWFSHYLYSRNKKYIIQLIFELIRLQFKRS
ncbi:nucleotidyltransferase family protein [Ekhidna sp.]|uniref:nucleotidyltransferase family protein n=1 Tax=Ekhidna sp. TaxID=2608089 RepID=UPI003B5CC56C